MHGSICLKVLRCAQVEDRPRLREAPLHQRGACATADCGQTRWHGWQHGQCPQLLRSRRQSTQQCTTRRYMPSYAPLQLAARRVCTTMRAHLERLPASGGVRHCWSHVEWPFCSLSIVADVPTPLAHALGHTAMACTSLPKLLERMAGQLGATAAFACASSRRTCSDLSRSSRHRGCSGGRCTGLLRVARTQRHSSFCGRRTWHVRSIAAVRSSS